MVVAFISVTMMFCTKEGPVGPRGPAGADGTDGNANVITYFFTDSATIAWSGSMIILNYDSIFFVPDSIINYGMILVYTNYASSVLWYPVPGLGYNANYVTRLLIGSSNIRITAYDPDGSTWSGGATLPQFDAIKVILVPATTVISMTADKVDLNNHEATMEYLGLE